MISNKVYQNAVNPPPSSFQGPPPATFQQRTGHLHGQPGQYSQAQYPGGQGGGQPRPSAAKFGRMNTPPPPPPPGNMMPPQGPPPRPQPGMRTGAPSAAQGFRSANFQDLSSRNVPGARMPGAASPHFPGQGAAPRAPYQGATNTGLPGSNPLGNSRPAARTTLGSAPPPMPASPPHTKLPPKPIGPSYGKVNPEFYQNARAQGSVNSANAPLGQATATRAANKINNFIDPMQRPSVGGGNFAGRIMKGMGLGGKMFGAAAAPLELINMAKEARHNYMVDNNMVGYEDEPPEQNPDGTFYYDILPGDYDDQGGTAPMGFQPNMVDNPEYQGALHYLINGTDPIKGDYNPYTDGI